MNADTPVKADARLQLLLSIPCDKLTALLQEHRAGTCMISPLYFGIAVDPRFSTTQPKELESLLEQALAGRKP